MNSLSAKTLHDLAGTCTDFRIMIDLIKSGYRFDDAEAPALLQQLEKDLKFLQDYLQNLKSERD